MAQLFPPSANVVTRVLLVGLPFAAIVLWGGAWLLYGSPYIWGQALAPEQPVPFSHEHHVGGLGIDCRYCHATVERSAFAGMPATHDCMSCHSQVWSDSEMLRPVRESYATGRPLRWARVYDLPDYVYFNHAAHVSHGVGCSTCHGAIDKMPLTRLANRLTMKWCLGCHADPSPYLRPRDEIFQMNWGPRPKGDQAQAKLLQAYGINPERMRDCCVCHR